MATAIPTNGSKNAERRGLLNLRTTPEAIPYLKRPENIALFERHHVLSEEEVLSRYEILMEEYVHLLNIEARTMIDMAGQGNPSCRQCLSEIACRYRSSQNLRWVCPPIRATKARCWRAAIPN